MNQPESQSEELKFPIYSSFSVSGKKIFLSVIILIFVTGCFLRISNLSSNPAGFFPDEASTGYDAWCLLNYGIDQHGKSWPFFFTSFADDLAGTYRYLVLISEWIFGHNIFAVRLPAAIAGCLTIFFCFLISRQLFPPAITALTVFLITFSPWHLPYCRTGQRIMLLPLALAIWFFFRIKFEKTLKPTYAILSYAVLGLSIYTYVAARIVSSLLFIACLLFDLHKFKLKQFIILIFVFLITLVPLIHHAADQPELFQLRFTQVSIFSKYPGTMDSCSVFLKNYFSHFNPAFLFQYGDSNLRHSQMGIGMLMWSQIPLIIAGVFLSVRKKNRFGWLLLIWLLIAPIPAALSIDGNPHALRSVSMILPWIFISSIGAQWLFKSFNQNSIYRIGIIVVLLIGVFEAGWISYDLLKRYPQYSGKAWEYGTLEAIDRCENLQDKYDEFWFSSNLIGADRIIAFHIQIPPQEFSQYGTAKTSFRWIWNIPVDVLLQQQSNRKRLFVIEGNECKSKPDAEQSIMGLDKQPAIRFVTQQ